MEFTALEGLRSVKFDLVLTLALAALFLFAGMGVLRRVGFLSRASIPAAAVGGLLFALIVLALRSSGTLGLTLDSSLRGPLQTAFFTTIGLSATFALLQSGGWRMIFFWLLASGTAVVQNVAGIGLARAVGAPPGLGIICGALTLTGGPATGLAFADLFKQRGIAGADALIIAAATFGIFMSSLVGNPVATALIRRFHLAPPLPAKDAEPVSREEDFWAIGSTGPIDDAPNEPAAQMTERLEGEVLTGGNLLRHLLLLLLLMGIGSLLSLGLTWLGQTLPPFLGTLIVNLGQSLSPSDGTPAGYFTTKTVDFGWWVYKFKLLLPGYVGAMIVAAVARNTDDKYKWLKLNTGAIDVLASISLSLFLVIALMDLKLWQLAGLALPMLFILGVQAIITVLYAVLITFPLMGRDYEAAVTTSGHIGFGLGITPNAVANMEALSARFGPAPRSFLVVPVVGAFFIDFTNVVIITTFLNLVS
ncbi:MAG: sodium/glutamate symporter [Pyrinomonadaceae bacterium]